ncbi:MAG TPA: BsuBI/PstI family type II restriction endonuclease [Azospirillum sp.]
MMVRSAPAGVAPTRPSLRSATLPTQPDLFGHAATPPPEPPPAAAIVPAAGDLPPLTDVATIKRRLAEIFPEGLADRNYVVREMAARTVFALLYVGAVEGGGVWLAPTQVCRMSDAQAALTDAESRLAFRTASTRPGFAPPGEPWYKDNTREPIRDETLRQGLITCNAVALREGIATTSSLGRYALKRGFVEVIAGPEEGFAEAARTWAATHLSADQLARTAILRDRVAGREAVEVRLPKGGSRVMSPGTSSILTKAVVEEFAPRHLTQPAVLWISESATKIVAQDDALMRRIGLPIDQQKLLPDVVLADLGGERMRLVFVEIVATDGPFTEDRKAELLATTRAAGFPDDQVVFVSVFEHRGAAPAKARFSSIAVNSYMWFMAEPELLVWLRAGLGGL